jgi:ubiquinone biosynthesis protein
MRRIRLLLRLLRIQRTLMRHGLYEIVVSTHLFRPLGWIQALVVGRRRTEPLGLRIRLALEALGPLFVKFGQAVSVRRDLLPVEVADELAKLQDRVPPFDSDVAVAMIEQALGKPLDECYSEFSREPLAAASIAQVHAAKLHDGREVIVKVLRPRVREEIESDLEVLFEIATLAERYWPGSRRLHPMGIVAEFEKTLHNELDLMREAANSAQLRRNFSGSELLYVPDVYCDYCRSNVMTMERIGGVPISDMEKLVAKGTNIRRLAENGVDIFFTQVFKHNFFHADMHPGNIFVDVDNPEAPKYMAVDFGIMGSLTSEDQRYLAENFLAFFRQDYRRVAALHIDSGWVPPNTRVDELEAAVRTVCEPIFDRPLKEISFGLVLLRLFETARRFDMEVQPQLVLLQKTLLAIEGLGRSLYPELDLWTTAKPVLEAWMREQRGPSAQLKRIADGWPEISDDLMALPEILHAYVTEHRKQRSSQPATKPATQAGIDARTPVGAALGLMGVIWTGLNASPYPVGWALTIAGVALLVAALIRGAK